MSWEYKGLLILLASGDWGSCMSSWAGVFFSIKRFGRLFSSFLDELGFSWGLIDIFSIYWDGQVDLDK